MNRTLRALLVIIGICIIYTSVTYYPVISASFDEEKYVDGEVFKPVNGEYDFRKFTLNSSLTRNYTAIIDTSGFAQFVDDKGNHTINVFEWDKMTNARRERINSSLQIEFEKESHDVENVTVFVGDFLNDTFYSAYIDDEESSTAIYVATPSENETIEMINTLKFK